MPSSPPKTAGPTAALCSDIGSYFGLGCHSRARRTEATLAIHCGRHVISTRTGISFLTGTAKSDGGSILKSDSVAGIVPDIRIWFP
jgi:hypothetical protein